MGWHCFKIVSSYQRTPSVDSGCPPLPSGPSNNSRTSSVHHGSAKMEKTILKRLTVNSRFSWWKSQILETQFQPGIDQPVRLHRPQIPGYFYFLIYVYQIIAYHCTRFRQNPFFRIHLIYRHPVVALCCHLTVAVLDFSPSDPDLFINQESVNI